MRQRPNKEKQGEPRFSFFGKSGSSPEEEAYRKEKPKDRRYVLVRLWGYLYRCRGLLFHGRLSHRCGFRCAATPIKLFLESCGVYTAVIV